MNHLLPWAASLLGAALFAPLQYGVINSIKAILNGRRGPSVFQPYYDLAKLLKKEGAQCSSANWLFGLAPVLIPAAVLTACLVMPFGLNPGLFAFDGDILLFTGLLGAARLVLAWAALDSGSAFAAMGASRDLRFSFYAETVFWTAAAFLIFASGKLSLAEIFAQEWNGANAAAFILTALALFIAALAECGRMPFTDPDTHLELTMVHEAMLLDFGGRDLAFLQYPASLRQWLLLSLPVLILLPAGWNNRASVLLYFVAVIAANAVIGVIEGTWARRRFLQAPLLLLSAFILLIAAFFIYIFAGRF